MQQIKETFNTMIHAFELSESVLCAEEFRTPYLSCTVCKKIIASGELAAKHLAQHNVMVTEEEGRYTSVANHVIENKGPYFQDFIYI